MRALNLYPDSRLLESVRAKAEWLSYSTKRDLVFTSSEKV